MKEFKLFLLISLSLFIFIAIVVFSLAYLEVAIEYLFSLVNTLSPINRTPAIILLCSIVPVTVISLLMATDKNTHK